MDITGKLQNLCQSYFHVARPESKTEKFLLGVKIISFALIIFPLIAGIALGITTRILKDRKVVPVDPKENDKAGLIHEVAKDRINGGESNELVRKRALDELNQMTYKDWIKGPGASEKVKAVISPEHLNEHLRAEAKEGNFTAFITFGHGMEVMSILDETNKNFLKKSFLETLKTSRFDSNKEAINAFGINNQELNKLYRDEAKKGDYLSFVGKYGVEVLDILDQENLQYLRRNYVFSGDINNEDVRSRFLLENEELNLPYNDFKSKFGFEVFQKLLADEQKQMVKNSFFNELLQACQDEKAARSTFKLDIEGLQISDKELRDLFFKEETILTFSDDESAGGATSDDIFEEDLKQEQQKSDEELKQKREREALEAAVKSGNFDIEGQTVQGEKGWLRSLGNAVGNIVNKIVGEK